MAGHLQESCQCPGGILDLEHRRVQALPDLDRGQRGEKFGQRRMQALQLPAHPARPLQPERLRGGGGPLGLQRIPEQRRMGQEPGPERR